MRSEFVKLVVGCGFLAASITPVLACDYYKTTVQNDQPVAQSQQTTPDAPQTAESQPTADTGSN
jgi:hypothetical protein